MIQANSVPLGIFLGSFGGGYPLCRYFLQKAFHKNPLPPMLVTFISGFIAGLAILLDFEKHGKERRVTLALYTFVRSLEMLFNSAVSRNMIKPWFHGDTFIFILSCTEIMYSWFYTPETLPPAYVTWITKMANMDLPLLEFLRLKRLGVIEYGKHSDTLTNYCMSYGIDPSRGNPINGLIDCSVVNKLILI